MLSVRSTICCSFAFLMLTACVEGAPSPPSQSATSQPLTRSEFIERYAEYLRDRHPGGDVAIQSDGTITYFLQDKTEITAFPDNIYADYLQSPDALQKLFREYQTGFEPLLREAKQDIDTLIPCVRSKFPLADIASDARFFTEHLVGDLYTAYCFDVQNRVYYGSAQEMRDLIARHPGYRRRAIQNIRRLPREPEFKLGDGWAVVINGGRFETSLILVDEVWERLHAHLGDDVVFGVPTRDLFISVDGRDAAQIARLREQVRTYHDRGPYQVSRKLFRHTAAGISIFED